MTRTTRLIFISLSAFFLLFPLAVSQPGMPVTLKADEPAYYLLALSLVEDGDVQCETRDLQRLYDAYPHLPIENLILMSTDGWKTVLFGKPYLFSALVAPAVALFGARGAVAFNMALFLGMIWMAFFYLRRYNSEALSALFAMAFFFLSSGFAYVFWLHPEILNMFAITACLFLALHTFGEPPIATRGPMWLADKLLGKKSHPYWSGALLAIAVYNKPMLAIVGVPALFAVFNRRGLKGAAAWLVAAAVSLGAISGVSVLLTGKPTPYLGTSRAGFKIEDPERLEDLIQPFRTPAASERRHSSYGWLVRVPKLFPWQLLDNIGYFFAGRHTGLLLYMPFAGLAFLLFLINDRRSPTRWLTVLSLAGLALFFLIWIHYNWHGGSGFIGNRYFVNAYPAFLFLVTVIRPAWLVVLGFIAGGLFISPIFFTPYGAAVPYPTLQTHTRGGAFEWFPLELSIRPLVPGYSALNTRGLDIRGRKDLMRVIDHGGGTFWVRGATKVELWISAARPLRSLAFAVSSPAPENLVALTIGEIQKAASFDDSLAGDARTVELILEPLSATKVRRQYGKQMHAYRLVIETDTGRNPRHPNGQMIEPSFYVGAELTLSEVRRERAGRAEPKGVSGETEPQG